MDYLTPILIQAELIATGITTSVREFVRMSFLELGIELVFEGSNEKEVAKVVKCTGPSILKTGEIVVEVDPKYYRPTEVDLLIGDATKAKEKLGWIPKYNLNDLVKEMVNSDYNKTKSKIGKNA